MLPKRRLDAWMHGGGSENLGGKRVKDLGLATELGGCPKDSNRQKYDKILQYVSFKFLAPNV